MLEVAQLTTAPGNVSLMTTPSTPMLPELESVMVYVTGAPGV